MFLSFQTSNSSEDSNTDPFTRVPSSIPEGKASALPECRHSKFIKDKTPSPEQPLAQQISREDGESVRILAMQMEDDSEIIKRKDTGCTYAKNRGSGLDSTVNTRVNLNYLGQAEGDSESMLEDEFTGKDDYHCFAMDKNIDYDSHLLQKQTISLVRPVRMATNLTTEMSKHLNEVFHPHNNHNHLEIDTKKSLSHFDTFKQQKSGIDSIIDCEALLRKHSQLNKFVINLNQQQRFQSDQIRPLSNLELLAINDGQNARSALSASPLNLH